MNHSHSEQLVKAFKTAINLSRGPHEEALDLWVLFVIEDNETNVGDQKMIELALFKQGITSIRLTLKQISKQAVITSEGSLVI